MKRILYIGNPISIHDLKWINYLNNSGEVDAYFSFENVIFVYENDNLPLGD